MINYPFDNCDCWSAHCYHKSFKRNLNDAHLSWQREVNGERIKDWDRLINKEPFALKNDYIEAGLLDEYLALEIENHDKIKR